MQAISDIVTMSTCSHTSYFKLFFVIINTVGDLLYWGRDVMKKSVFYLVILIYFDVYPIKYFICSDPEVDNLEVSRVFLMKRSSSEENLIEVGFMPEVARFLIASKNFPKEVTFAQISPLNLSKRKQIKLLLSELLELDVPENREYYNLVTRKAIDKGIDDFVLSGFNNKLAVSIYLVIKYILFDVDANIQLGTIKQICEGAKLFELREFELLVELIRNSSKKS